MKPLFILLIAHLVLCGTVGYLFRQRAEVRHDFVPPVEHTTPEQRSRSQVSFLMAQSRTTITFPRPVLLYGVIGLLALALAFIIELYHFFTYP